MASISWTSNASGTWSNTSNWSLASGPLTGDDVTIVSTVSPIVVTYGSGTLQIHALETSNAAFSLTAGALDVTSGYTLNGGLSVGGGTLRLASGNGGNSVTGSVSLTGGALTVLGTGAFYGSSFVQSASSTLQIARGTLIDQESFSTLGGTIAGAGALLLNGSITTLGAGFVLATGSVTIENSTVFLDENLSYGKGFTLSQAGTLNLGTSTLTLTGVASLGGVISNSVLAASGTGHFNSLTLENGTRLSLTGTYSQTGAINLGQTGTGTISIASQGVLRIAGNDAISNTNQGGVLSNAGTLIKTAGNAIGGVTRIEATVYNTGTIDAAVGTIAFYAPANASPSTLGGTLAGAGTVAFEAGNFLITSNALDSAQILLAGSAGVTLTTSALSYGGAFAQTGGTLVVGTPAQSGGSMLTLTGSDDFDGGLLKGTGTVLCSGAVHLGNNVTLEGNLTFDFGTSAATAVVSQTGNIDLGAELDAITTANLAAGESWLLQGASSIYGVNGTINNAGLFEKASGGGDSVVQNSIVNTGSLVVESGVLTLSGGGVLGGSVSGGAALDISGNVIFASGLSLTVGEVILDLGQVTLDGAVSYANGWSQEGGTLALAGQTLTLGGVTSLQAGAIEGGQGGGAVVITGAATLDQGPANGQALSLLQGAQLVVDGATEQGGTITMTGGSTAPTLTIGSAGVYTLDAGASIGLPGSSIVGTVSVGGSLVASGAGISSINAAVVDNGAIKVSNGDLSFMGPLTGTGSVTISSGGTVELNGTQIYGNTIGFGPGGGLLTLAHPSDFTGVISGFGSGDVIELQGFAFADMTPVVSGKDVTLTESSGQSITLAFSTAQSGSLLTLGAGPYGGLALIHT